MGGGKGKVLQYTIDHSNPFYKLYICLGEIMQNLDLSWIWPHYCPSASNDCFIDDILIPWYKLGSNLNYFQNIYNETWILQEQEFQWQPNEPNGKSFETHIACRRDGCRDYDKYVSAYFFCSIPAKTQFRLRGLCLKTALDTEYVPLSMVAGQLVWMGAAGTWVVYDKKWNSIVQGSSARAVSKSTHQSLLLGLRDWKIFNDFACFGDDYETKLSLTACTNEEFNCDNAKCVPIHSRCDGIPYCPDRSDEKGCDILVADESYNSAVADLKFKNISLRISTEIVSFLMINDVEGKIRLKYRIKIEWKDSRLIYKNLKMDYLKNQLNEAEEDSIWKPVLQLLDSDTHTRNTHGRDQILVSRDPLSLTYTADLSYLYNALFYPGDLNSLVFITTKR